MHLVVLPLLLSVAMAADMAKNVGAGDYNFNYSYKDPNGNMSSLNYTAVPDGFKPSGDITVDKKTAEEVARIATLAPEAPAVPVLADQDLLWNFWNGALPMSADYIPKMRSTTARIDNEPH